jgi:thiamine pyrophosphokinase
VKKDLPRTLLICNGEPPSTALLRRLARRADNIVAADGGANAALRAGIRPDIVIGDLDSILPGTRKKIGDAHIIHIERQDNTDLEKALDYISGAGPSDVVIAGATGGRIDFTLGNLSVFWNYTRSLAITFAGDGWEAFPVDRRRTLKAPRGTTVSLIPFGTCSGITLTGLLYPLKDATMRTGEIGVSNVVKNSSFSVTVRKGNMLVVIYADVPGRTGPHGW